MLFQPVLPFDLGGGDTFIVRPIVAGVREINVKGISGSPFTGSGIASVTVESFYAPNTNSSWIWGIGPYAISPSGNSGKFGPLNYITESVTRMWQLPPTKVLGPDQAISVDDTIRAVTINAAYQIFADRLVGSLELGK